MELQTHTGMPHVIPSAVAATLIMLIYVLAPRLSYRLHLARLPACNGDVGKGKELQPYFKYASNIYRHGYEKFRNSVCRIAVGDGEDNVVVPLELLPELRKLLDDVLSFTGAVDNTMEVKYTGFISDGQIVVHSVKSDLTPALARLSATMSAEVEASLKAYMPLCEDWSEVSIYKTLVDVVAKVSDRIFVGPELCQDPEYLDNAGSYTMDVVHAIEAIKKLRPWLKPFLAPSLPEVRRLHERERKGARYLQPIIEERQNAAKNDTNWQQPDDMLQWILNRSTEYNIASPAKFAKLQLELIFAAIHTTTMTATNVLYTLATTPEYIDLLRDEIRNVMANHDGYITSQGLQQMEKLDSYMKEVVRCYPTNITSFGRRVMKGVTLSNGQYLPPGVIIEVPSHAIYSDPKLYPDSETFDGFRHYKLRRSGNPTDNARNQFVTTNELNLFWGYGRHACPGRFFATNEIKMILIRLILEYDIKMPDGQTERYPQVDMGRSSSPYPAKVLLFKKVEA